MPREQRHARLPRAAPALFLYEQDTETRARRSFAWGVGVIDLCFRSVFLHLLKVRSLG